MQFKKQPKAFFFFKWRGNDKQGKWKKIKSKVKNIKTICFSLSISPFLGSIRLTCIFSLFLQQTTYADSRTHFKNNYFQFSDTAGYVKGKEHRLLSSRALSSELHCTINQMCGLVLFFTTFKVLWEKKE